MNTLAIHFIWTTYGTWLPGDERGHWSPLYDLYGKIQAAGNRLNLPDEWTREVARERMVESEKVLSADETTLLAPLIGRTAGFRAHAAAIEPTHVHLLTGPLRENVARVAGRLKGSTSSALLKHSLNTGRRRIWTTGYWKVFLYDMDAVLCVKNYIEEHNERRGLPRAPWDWIHPI